MPNGKQQNSHELPDLMTLEEVAGFLRFAKSTIYRLIDSRKLKCFKLSGSYRFNKADVIEYVENNCREPLVRQ